jgi:hypothetical protein
MTTDTHTARDIDMQLAELHGRVYATNDKLDRNAMSFLHMAGAEFYYRGRQRVTDMDVATAIDIVTEALATIDPAGDEYGYTRLPVGTRSHYSTGQARTALANRAELETELDAVLAEVKALNAQYTGWSRFFLVTSSAGHVHSSMHCSTCRPTTRYGWLPELSGKTEDVAVAELGPSLCSVCFPSAPLDWTTGKKLTKAQAAKVSA